jgi:hypothetical protein
MAGKHGALGATFLIVRIFQAISLIAIIGMTANFISQIVTSNATPPNVLIGVICVVGATWTWPPRFERDN